MTDWIPLYDRVGPNAISTSMEQIAFTSPLKGTIEEETKRDLNDDNQELIEKIYELDLIEKEKNVLYIKLKKFSLIINNDLRN